MHSGSLTITTRDYAPNPSNQNWGWASHPVVVLTGPRQVGKSTLLRRETPFKDWSYVTLDDLDVLRVAQEDPETLWENTDRLIVDEVQRCPEMLLAIKRAVDLRMRKIRFVLSGSANLLLMAKVSESLAGRAVYFELLPMTASEQGGRVGENVVAKLLSGRRLSEGKVRGRAGELSRTVWAGGMPPTLNLKTENARVEWWGGYVSMYLERDLRQLSQVDSLPDFRRLMEALAVRSGQLVNQTDLGRTAGLSQSSARRYINLLEASCLIRRVPAYAWNLGKRVLKSPKAYWVDSGLACYLAGLRGAEAVAQARELGVLFETAVLTHLEVACSTMAPRGRAAYWRTVSGQEVDFIIEEGRRCVAVEVKSTTRAKFEDTRMLKVFAEARKRDVSGLLVYAGDEIRYLGTNIVAVPWHSLC